MASLLPPRHAVGLRFTQQPLDERLAAQFDAVLVVCPKDTAQRHLKRLPNAALWRKIAGETHKDGATPELIAQLPNRNATTMVVGFVKENASAFAALTLAAKWVREAKLQRCRNVLVDIIGVDTAHPIREALVAALLAAAAPLPEFKSSPSRPHALAAITIRGGKTNFASTLATHRGNHLARWLTALPPNQLDSRRYAETLRALAKQQGWTFRRYGETELRRLGAGAFLAVTRANAHRDASIVKLSYRPKRCTERTLALVGKGVCFDTGGINLKTHKSMYSMHEDMQGSAVAVGTLLALTDLDAPFAVDCWLALTENEIGPQAYRPQDIVTALNGVTIQVAHSDAEGRMALADTLALAARDQPELILDFATLTGACIGALTERMSGVFTNRPTWRPALETAGAKSGERVWSFPMDEDYDSDLDSSVADILHCTPDSKGDHILAARFLNRFVPQDIAWVHVDLAASSRTGGLAHIPTEITGFGVRFAVEFLMNEGAGPVA